MNKKTMKSKVYNPDFGNLPLAEYYDALPPARRRVFNAPKEDFLKELSIVTGRTTETVRSWCLGSSTPPMHVQERIAKHMKSTPEILFPNEKH